MKVVFILFIFSLDLAFGRNLLEFCDSNFNYSINDRLERQVGVLEVPRNSNRGDSVDAYNRYVGVPLGSSWCASLQIYSFRLLGDSLLRLVASAGTQRWWRNARSRHLTTDKPFINSWVIWYKSNSQGHIGYVIRCYADGSFDTIEGNTSSYSSGDQRNGDGVYYKHRKGNISRTIKLRGFVRWN